MSESALDGVCPERIGPAGRAARLAVGLGLIVLELFWRNPKWWDPVLGLALVPLLLTGLALLRSARRLPPLRATGGLGHSVNLIIFVTALLVPLTAGAALLFYGGSMLVAAATANGGCEVTAISNLIAGRDDQVGCAVFAPIDIAERTLAGGVPDDG